MKKKFKKLSLNTETLRNLKEPDLKEAAGGETENCTLACTRFTAKCTFCTVGCTVCCP